MHRTCRRRSIATEKQVVHIRYWTFNDLYLTFIQGNALIKKELYSLKQNFQVFLGTFGSLVLCFGRVRRLAQSHTENEKVLTRSVWVHFTVVPCM